MAFQAGTDRDGFKRALLSAFKSAHAGKSFGAGNAAADNPKLPRNQNNDPRAAQLMPGGNQAFRFPDTGGPAVLGGGSHSDPAQTATGPVNHNNDTRRTGLMTDGHQANRVKLTTGSATNSHTLMPKGHQANKIKLPKNQNNDSRPLRKGSGV